MNTESMTQKMNGEPKFDSGNLGISLQSSRSKALEWTRTPRPLSNHELVTLAVYLPGGEGKQVDIEDVALRHPKAAAVHFEFAW